MAVHIQFPQKSNSYQTYTFKNNHKLPIPDETGRYYKWNMNDHHYTTLYHKQYVIPLVSQLLHIPFDENWFIWKHQEAKGYDISHYVSRQAFSYECWGYSRDEHLEHASFDDLVQNPEAVSEYHTLFRYIHECSRIVNKNCHNGRKLFAIGDSQFAISIPVLTCFFQEVWFFDNRLRKSFKDKWENVDFTDSIIATFDAREVFYTSNPFL